MVPQGMIIRHNWALGREGFECWSSDMVTRQDTKPTCCHCDAVLPLPPIQREIGRTMGNPRLYSMLDKLWSEEYRPMAAFCAMVEESQGET